MKSNDLLVDVLAATRITRLIVEDTFPPIKRRRDRFVERHSTEEQMRQAPGASPEAFGKAFGCPPQVAEQMGQTHPGSLTGLTLQVARREWVVLRGDHSLRVTPLADLAEEDRPEESQINGDATLAQEVLDQGIVTGTYWKPDDLAELITCPWCAGFWICCAVVLARKVAPRWWDPIARSFAASMVVGLVESKVDVEE